MKKQKVVVLSGTDYTSAMEMEVNGWLEKGWRVVSVTAQHVASSSSGIVLGGFFIVLEREK